mmetsp:Transcript_54297/g.144871  ORF Transcript_54297/g.144871 Transcript_54297/m.144871 type:complete len:237 (-) Transcript_54297:117-827(-)
MRVAQPGHDVLRVGAGLGRFVRPRHAIRVVHLIQRHPRHRQPPGHRHHEGAGLLGQVRVEGLVLYSTVDALHLPRDEDGHLVGSGMGVSAAGDLLVVQYAVLEQDGGALLFHRGGEVVGFARLPVAGDLLLVEGRKVKLIRHLDTRALRVAGALKILVLPGLAVHVVVVVLIGVGAEIRGLQLLLRFLSEADAVRGGPDAGVLGAPDVQAHVGRRGEVELPTDVEIVDQHRHQGNL